MTAKPITLPVRQAELDNAKRHLSGRLVLAINASGDTGDVGVISQLVADIRALDFVGPLIETPANVKPAIAPEVTKDADTARVRAQSERIAKQERQEAERAETHGEDAVEQPAKAKGR